VPAGQLKQPFLLLFFFKRWRKSLIVRGKNFVFRLKLAFGPDKKAALPGKRGLRVFLYKLAPETGLHFPASYGTAPGKFFNSSRIGLNVLRKLFAFGYFWAK
jgi:hypothetical protein